MTTAKSLPGFQSPATGFHEPFEMLDACHDRLSRSLDLLGRLQRHLADHGVDDPARQAAIDVLRYFTIAAPLHHEDEERHIVPLLRESGQAALVDASRQLMRDHEQIRQAWRTLEPQLREVARGEAPHPRRFADTVHRFVRMNESHLAFERAQAFPPARELKAAQGPETLAMMGQEMAARRRSDHGRA